MISTANKVNAVTQRKTKKNRNGETIAAVTKGVRIARGVRVYSTTAQMRSRIKQSEPQYDSIKTFGDGFRFYGTVIGSANGKKGWWNVEYDLFPTETKMISMPRGILTTVPPGADEPAYHPRHDKIAEAINNIETLVECDNNHCDILLADSDDDLILSEQEDNDENPLPKKKKKKVTKKVASLRSFLDMSDECVLEAVTFDHYYGEDEGDFIRWDILKDGEEIVEDMMHHPPTASPFAIDIPWSPSVHKNNYFEIFFEHFFPPLEGKAAVLDEYLSDERCSAYTYYKHDNIKFHRPDEPDPDYIVSCCYDLLICFLWSK